MCKFRNGRNWRTFFAIVTLIFIGNINGVLWSQEKKLQYTQLDLSFFCLKKLDCTEKEVFVFKDIPINLVLLLIPSLLSIIGNRLVECTLEKGVSRCDILDYQEMYRFKPNTEWLLSFNGKKMLRYFIVLFLSNLSGLWIYIFYSFSELKPVRSSHSKPFDGKYGQIGGTVIGELAQTTSAEYMMSSVKDDYPSPSKRAVFIKEEKKEVFIPILLSRKIDKNSEVTFTTRSIYLYNMKWSLNQVGEKDTPVAQDGRYCKVSLSFARSDDDFQHQISVNIQFRKEGGPNLKSEFTADLKWVTANVAIQRRGSDDCEIVSKAELNPNSKFPNPDSEKAIKWFGEVEELNIKNLSSTTKNDRQVVDNAETYLSATTTALLDTSNENKWQKDGILVVAISSIIRAFPLLPEELRSTPAVKGEKYAIITTRSNGWFAISSQLVVLALIVLGGLAKPWGLGSKYLDGSLAQTVSVFSTNICIKDWDCSPPAYGNHARECFSAVSDENDIFKLKLVTEGDHRSLKMVSEQEPAQFLELPSFGSGYPVAKAARDCRNGNDNV